MRTSKCKNKSNDKGEIQGFFASLRMTTLILSQNDSFEAAGLEMTVVTRR
jgi:hypothetical protein